MNPVTPLTPELQTIAANCIADVLREAASVNPNVSEGDLNTLAESVAVAFLAGVAKLGSAT